MATYQKCNGLADTSFNDSLITKWIRDTLNSDTLAPFTQYTFGSDPVFISLLIDELTTNGNDTFVIKKYTVGEILGWDETLAQDLLEAYANTATDYDEIINELVDHERSKLVDALITHDAHSFIDAVLTEDASNDFLDCYTTQEVDDLWNALITPPTSSATKADRIADLMTSADRTSLIIQMLDVPSGMYAETVDHLKTCAAASELKDALHDPSFTTRALMLEALANGIGATTLTTFFTTGKDPKPWRPAKLLHKHGNATYILNVLASNATDFVYQAIRLDHTVVDDVLKGYEAFSTVEYINAVSKYFGKDVARRVFNALLSNFEYTREFLAQEYNIYGSSRVGVKKDTSVLLYQKFKDPVVDDNGDFDLTSATTLEERKAVLDTVNTSRVLAFKQYELSNHLGNVLATVLDRRSIYSIDTSVSGSDTTFTALWDADITTAQDYYPFGMLLPNRVYNADSTGTGDYRYAFNGYERLDNLNGTGNAYDFGARIYDSRLSKFISVDPAASWLISMSPYSFSANNPICFVDKNGKHPIYPKRGQNEYGEKQVHKIQTLHKGGMYTAEIIIPEGTPLTKGMTDVEIYKLAILRVFEPGEHLVNDDVYLDEKYLEIEQDVRFYFSRSAHVNMTNSDRMKEITAEIHEAVQDKLLHGSDQEQIEAMELIKTRAGVFGRIKMGETALLAGSILKITRSALSSAARAPLAATLSESLASNPLTIVGKTTDEIVAAFVKDGYKATASPLRTGRGMRIMVEGHSQINQIKLHYGGGRHAVARYQILGQNKGSKLSVKVVRGTKSEYKGNIPEEEAAGTKFHFYGNTE